MNAICCRTRIRYYFSFVSALPLLLPFFACFALGARATARPAATFLRATVETGLVDRKMFPILRLMNNFAKKSVSYGYWPIDIYFYFVPSVFVSRSLFSFVLLCFIAALPVCNRCSCSRSVSRAGGARRFGAHCKIRRKQIETRVPRVLG